MGLLGVAIIVCLGGLILWLIYTYNRFVAKQSKIDEIWDEVDTHLKMRHELIPELLKVASARMPAQKTLFNRMEEIAREVDESPESPDVERLENELSSAMSAVRSAVGAQPDLMMDQALVTTLGELVSMEGRAATSCERHNELVREFNESMKQFPANMVVGFLHFQPCEMRIFGTNGKPNGE